MPITSQQKIALLIDAENISPKYTELIFEAISEYGFTTHKRIYGNVEALNNWRNIVLKYAMTPVLQFNYTNGKNASDSALIIDAMDILHSGVVDGFCLVTSDSDFTKLAIRLREAGMFVIGMGEQKTPESLMRACEEFKYLDILFQDKTDNEDFLQFNLPPDSNSGQDNPSNATPQIPESNNLLPDTAKLKDDISRIMATVFKDKEWVRLGELGNAVPKNIPGFNLKFYGFSKWKKLIETFSDRFELREIPDKNSVPDLYVRDKQ